MLPDWSQSCLSRKRYFPSLVIGNVGQHYAVHSQTAHLVGWYCQLDRFVMLHCHRCSHYFGTCQLVSQKPVVDMSFVFDENWLVGFELQTNSRKPSIAVDGFFILTVHGLSPLLFRPNVLDLQVKLGRNFLGYSMRVWPSTNNGKHRWRSQFQLISDIWHRQTFSSQPSLNFLAATKSACATKGFCRNVVQCTNLNSDFATRLHISRNLATHWQQWRKGSFYLCLT